MNGGTSLRLIIYDNAKFASTDRHGRAYIEENTSSTLPFSALSFRNYVQFQRNFTRSQRGLMYRITSTMQQPYSLIIYPINNIFSILFLPLGPKIHLQRIFSVCALTKEMLTNNRPSSVMTFCPLNERANASIICACNNRTLIINGNGKNEN